MSPWSEQQANEDAALKRRVSAFLQNQFFPSFKHVEIKVDRGAVTLSGTVRSFHERQVVLKAREHVAGIERLFDFIRVGQLPDSPQADERPSTSTSGRHRSSVLLIAT